MRLIAGIVVMALALGGAGCSGQDVGAPCPAEGCGLQEMRTLPYTSPASVLRMMEVVTPDQDGSWPVVIVAHGFGQKRRYVRDWATGIAARGAVTYNVDWPTGSEELAERLACAVRVALDDAANHGADTSRFVFVGHSLGASVGAAVSLGGSTASADCAVADGDALPDAFVGYEGGYDLTEVAPEGVPVGADPYAQIGGNPDLVLRLLHGDAGVTVPMSASEDFAQALGDAGYDAELVVVKGGDHGSLSEGSPAQQAVVDQVTDLLNSL
jgi:acetyl esterase/lipase